MHVGGRERPIQGHIVTINVGKARPRIETISIGRHAADAEMRRIVFQNRLIDGVRAMQGRGTIRVDVEPRESNCQIALADGGPGIPAEIGQRIFTPFFTTKSRIGP